MCDYSLMGVPNRLANTGEELIVHTFRTGSKGLISPEETAPANWNAYTVLWDRLKDAFRVRSLQSVCAVCIPPGALLVLRDIPRAIQSSAGVRSVENVTFTQLDTIENRHRDAVRFSNGSTILLQYLSNGQRVTVVSLNSANDVSCDDYVDNARLSRINRH